MINLIPKEEKKKLNSDFYYKLGILFFTMFSFSIFVACVTLIPAYFISNVKKSSVNTRLETLKNTPLPFSGDKSIATIKDTNNKLTLIETSSKNKFLISEKILNAILLKKRPDVKITQILYESSDTLGKKVSVLGSAPSREILLLFRKTLEENPVYKNVDLPISNFVKGSNIQFYLNLIPS